MNKYVKTLIAAALAMGAFSSFAAGSEQARAAASRTILKPFNCKSFVDENRIAIGRECMGTQSVVSVYQLVTKHLKEDGVLVQHSKLLFMFAADSTDDLDRIKAAGYHPVANEMFNDAEDVAAYQTMNLPEGGTTLILVVEKTPTIKGSVKTYTGFYFGAIKDKNINYVER